jgi:hypothetical protein
VGISPSTAIRTSQPKRPGHDRATPGSAPPEGGIVDGAMFHSLQLHPQFALAGLLGWVALYLLYKVGWRRDFGLPVRRRLLARGLRVEREQLAFVPFWWSDIQVQRALDGHWRRTLRRGIEHRVSRPA